MDRDKKLIYDCPKEYQNSLWYRYAVGYKDAALLIIDNLSLSDSELSKEIIFPIFYLFRHFTELLLKQIIAEYASLVGNRIEIPKTHNLLTLWNKVKPICKDVLFIKLEAKGSHYRTTMSEDSLKIMDSYIIELNKYDKHATAFRFPVDQSGTISLKVGFSVPLNSIKDRINTVFNTLDHITFAIMFVKFNELDNLHYDSLSNIQ